MAYIRPRPNRTLSKEEKIELLKEYFDYYKDEIRRDTGALNQKIPREALCPLLELIGAMLLEEAKRLAEEDGPVKEFLESNPLPVRMDELLPKDFRAFCLILNALKQWVAAEQSATDRYLLGGTARKTCRSITDRCLITGEALGEDMELHHPIRDGRPPVVLSKKGHALIEGQSSETESANTPYEILVQLRRGRRRSWVQLRNGCLDLLGQSASFSTKNIKATSRTFAKQASEITGLAYEQILDWLDENGLGL